MWAKWVKIGPKIRFVIFIRFGLLVFLKIA